MILRFALFLWVTPTVLFASTSTSLVKEGIAFLEEQSLNTFTKPNLTYELLDLTSSDIRESMRAQYHIDQAVSNVMTKITDRDSPLDEKLGFDDAALAGLLEDFLQKPHFKRLPSFAREKAAYFEDVYDPIFWGSYRLRNDKLPPQGLYLAAVVDQSNRDKYGKPKLAMSMHVMPCPSKTFQIHQWIYKSPAYLVQAHLSGQQITSLSINLHLWAKSAVGAQYVAARPLKQMKAILLENGFQKRHNFHAQILMGDDYTYEREWSRVAETFEIVYGPH